MNCDHPPSKVRKLDRPVLYPKGCDMERNGYICADNAPFICACGTKLCHDHGPDAKSKGKNQ